MMSKFPVIAAAMVLCVESLVAQDPSSRPTFRTDANYVRVDVYPTRDGSPVTDLTADDFEVFEEGAAQTVVQFQRVVAGAGSQTSPGREPSTVAESSELVRDSNGRLVVLFLDPRHVDLTASRNIGAPLAQALNSLIGPNDLLGVMVPGMAARDIAFGRRTTTIENVLARDWWGSRDRVLAGDDPIERSYASCYPGVPASASVPAVDQGIAQEMILRRREQQTLDALQDLAVHLRSVREERKSVLVISDGWTLYRPNPVLARPVDSTPPPTTAVGVDPRSGRLRASAAPGDTSLRTCEGDRMALAALDHEARLRTIIDEANRSNATFYPIDPRGLVAFDDNIVPAAGVGGGPQANPTLSPREENRRLTSRAAALRTLADGTDGLAVVGTNDLATGLRRIMVDLSAYYLLGYYSTGKLDGRFHRITVRVKRPGVSVRARRGYQALRAADLTAGSAIATPSTTAAVRPPVATALDTLSEVDRGASLRVMAAVASRPAVAGAPGNMVWVTGEIADRLGGAEVDASLLDGGGQIVATARRLIPAGTTAVLLTLFPTAALAPGEYSVRLVARSPTKTETATLAMQVPQVGDWSGVVFYRSGPASANRDVVTADRRYRRTERLRLDAPSTEPVTARLLDRLGNALRIPVVLGIRTDAEGSWVTASVTLAPLAPGDYVVELTGETTRTFGFRVIP